MGIVPSQYQRMRGRIPSLPFLISVLAQGNILLRLRTLRMASPSANTSTPVWWFETRMNGPLYGACSSPVYCRLYFFFLAIASPIGLTTINLNHMSLPSVRYRGDVRSAISSRVYLLNGKAGIV